jgi:hypothetical protein
MPITATGKLAEDELRRIAREGYATVLPGTATAHEVETAVCRIWADALAGAAVRPETNVFDLGAHSLVVTRVHQLLQSALGVEFPVHYLFEYPRPRELAGRIALCRGPSVPPTTAREHT